MPKGVYKRRAGPFSSKGALALYARTNSAKLLRKISTDLLDHLGSPTAPQRIIVQNASFKALRCALFTERMLNAPDALSERSEHNILAWSNSLRLDLQALGLERRERPTLDLASYLARKGYVAETDATTPDEPEAADATTTYAAA